MQKGVVHELPRTIFTPPRSTRIDRLLSRVTRDAKGTPPHASTCGFKV